MLVPGGRMTGGSVPVPGEGRTLCRGRRAGAGAEGGRLVPVPGSKDRCRCRERRVDAGAGAGGEEPVLEAEGPSWSRSRVWMTGAGLERSEERRVGKAVANQRLSLEELSQAQQPWGCALL